MWLHIVLYSRGLTHTGYAGSKAYDEVALLRPVQAYDSVISLLYSNISLMYTVTPGLLVALLAVGTVLLQFIDKYDYLACIGLLLLMCASQSIMLELRRCTVGRPAARGAACYAVLLRTV
jgi:hypothetical protein